MKFRIVTLILLAIILLLSVSQVDAQIPLGGTTLINDANTYYSKSGKGTLTISKIDSLSFPKVLKYTTANDVGNAWDAQLVFAPSGGITLGDVILVSFFARTASSIQETGEGFLNVCIENKTTYDKVLYQSLSLGAEWKQYFVPIESLLSLTVNNLNCAFHFGFASQSVEIADIQFLNYKKTKTVVDLPVTEITYSGRETDASWRVEAEDRINQIRKGNVKFAVVGKNGIPIKDAEVTISMMRHNFGFGSAITVSNYLNNTTYKAKILEMFNEVVFENDLKWNAFILKNTQEKAQISQVLDDLDRHNIKVRGHNVLWPSWKYSPAYLENYKTSPDNLSLEINKHIDEICSFTKNRVNDWDVINEPFTEQDFMNVLGKSAMVDWFKRVRANDQQAKLYLNDFAILSSNGVNYKKQDAYIETIKYINNLGGGVQGIGFQGHFSSDLTPIPRLKTILDKFSVLNMDIKITEFDIDINQQQVQADYTRDFMTMMFSHPSVKSILMWGFWENNHWKPKAAIYNADWTLRPHGLVYRDLILNKWWTKPINSITDQIGMVVFNGFLGTYSYSIKYNGKNYVGSFDVLLPVSSGIVNEFTVYIDDIVPAGIDNASSEYASLFFNTPVNVDIFNVQGKMLCKNQYSKFSEMSIMSKLTKGIYLFRIRDKNSSKTFKIANIQMP